MGDLDQTREDVGLPGLEDRMFKVSDVPLEEEHFAPEADRVGPQLGDFTFDVIVAGLEGTVSRAVALNESRVSIDVHFGRGWCLFGIGTRRASSSSDQEVSEEKGDSGAPREVGPELRESLRGSLPFGREALRLMVVREWQRVKGLRKWLGE